MLSAIPLAHKRWMPRPPVNCTTRCSLRRSADPTQLAPLAYSARKTIKLYVRTRSKWPARVVCQLLDGYRAWRQTGEFRTDGLSYAAIYKKYYAQVTETVDDDDLSEHELAIRIGRKILERACVSNPTVDAWVPDGPGLSPAELEQITMQLERDVEELLKSDEEWYTGEIGIVSSPSYARYRRARRAAQWKKRWQFLRRKSKDDSRR